jgi:hypothetical protein
MEVCRRLKKAEKQLRIVLAPIARSERPGA